jgi:hypothetical protein
MSRIACGWIDVGRLGRRLSSPALAERRQRSQNLLRHTVYQRIVGILFEIVDEDAADELLRSLSLSLSCVALASVAILCSPDFIPSPVYNKISVECYPEFSSQLLGVKIVP